MARAFLVHFSDTIGPKRTEEFRIDWPWGDGIGRDTVVPQFQCHGTGQPNNASLRCSIGRDVDRTHKPSNRRNTNDAAIVPLAHITGGGLRDNLERILPDNTQAVLERGSWPIPPVFTWLQKLGNVAPAEMDRVFNCGIGFTMIVSHYYADSIRERLTKEGIPTFAIGEVREGEAGVEWIA